MTRSFHQIACADDILAATFDSAKGSTALLIVSGGNEIRSGAHGGMAQLALRIAEQGFPVLRYDRRGIGESTGQNSGFPGSAEDIAEATKFLRQEQRVQKIIAFGNCDAATALALFGPDAGIDRYLLANPWEETAISSAAIRSRYWDRIRNPRTIIDLLSGKIDVKKLLKGLKQAARSEENSALSLRLRDALSGLEKDAHILLAKRDTTARAFLAAWNSADFEPLRRNSNIIIETLDSASHSFADVEAKNWLVDRILDALRKA
jgi:exosortase A-associated hydrolase 1